MTTTRALLCGSKHERGTLTLEQLDAALDVLAMTNSAPHEERR